MKNIKILLAMLLPLALFFSCEDYYGDDVDDEDYLVGNSWRLVKTVYTEDVPGGFSHTEYMNDEVSYRFDYGGNVSMKSTVVSHFGEVYTDWFDARWECYNGDLRIVTYNRDAEWLYRLHRIDHWTMILTYYDEYVDDWGNRVPERVEEYYER